MFNLLHFAFFFKSANFTSENLYENCHLLHYESYVY
jgi:hypothetical protein